MSGKINLAIIFGGPSDEHEVSCSSARGIIKNLDRKKYNTFPILINRQGQWLAENENKKPFDFTKLSALIDLAIPIGHGSFMEDGRLQGMLEMIRVPYLFSGVLASALAMDKNKTKVIAKKESLTIISDVVLRKGCNFDLEKIADRPGLPAVVKPLELGSSVGISLIKTMDELEKGINTAFKHCKKVMIEKYIKGRELTVGVLGNNPPHALPVIEILPQVSDFYDYKAKYAAGGSKHECPANIPVDISEKAQSEAIKIFKALDCHDLARADFIWDDKNKQLYFLEINTIPGMTPTSLVPEAAKAAGMGFGQFLDSLVMTALERK